MLKVPIYLYSLILVEIRFLHPFGETLLTRCQMETCMRKIMMKSTLNSWVISKEKTGKYKPIFMAMEAQILGKKKDITFGLTLQMIFINIAFFGLNITSCE